MLHCDSVCPACGTTPMRSPLSVTDYLRCGNCGTRIDPYTGRHLPPGPPDVPAGSDVPKCLSSPCRDSTCPACSRRSPTRRRWRGQRDTGILYRRAAPHGSRGFGRPPRSVDPPEVSVLPPREAEFGHAGERRRRSLPPMARDGQNSTPRDPDTDTAPVLTAVPFIPKPAHLAGCSQTPSLNCSWSQAGSTSSRSPSGLANRTV
jgi:hypothetical protein